MGFEDDLKPAAGFSLTTYWLMKYKQMLEVGCGIIKISETSKKYKPSNPKLPKVSSASKIGQLANPKWVQ